jgi:predicted dehydrogenase
MASRAKARVRYAVVGLGHIAQVAVLPAFTNARKNSELVALVSDDPVKRQELGEQYSVEHTYSYEDYDRLLQSGLVDAVYIALPNHMHCEYTVRAAEAGIHVLCEKPMAVTEDECWKMITAAEQSNIKLMIAYRLHFEKSNLKAIELVQSGVLGVPRFFSSVFTNQIREGDIRLQRETGGGTVLDIGIYCINAARYLFRSEPVEVTAVSVSGPDPRFREVDEMTSAVLRFPDNRLATFTSSFGTSDVSSYRVVGTKGDLRVEPAYEYVQRLTHYVTVDGSVKQHTFRTRDQFAPELIYFSRCIQTGERPEPCGHEGLADVRVIQAIYQSAKEKRPIAIPRTEKQDRPTLEQEIYEPPVSPPDLVHTQSPSQ